MALFYDILITSGIIIAALLAVILLYHRFQDAKSWEFKHKKTSSFLATLLLLGMFLIIYGSFIEPKFLITTKQKIDLEKIQEPIRIALISDIHVGDFNKKADIDKIVNRIISLNPDLVFIDGDHIMADYKEDNRLEYLQPLKRLSGKFPVFAVNGNHEYGVGDNDEDIQKRFRLPNRSAEVAEAMRQLGINYLVNETEKIEVKGQSFLLFGGDEFLINAINFTSLDESREANPNLSVIALIHNPASVKLAAEHGVDLLLSGHTHGGQIRLPFVGIIMKIETDIPRRWYQGLNEYQGVKLFVTSGANESGARARLFNPPEVVLLTIE